MDYRVISFYRYVALDTPSLLVEKIKQFCHEHAILGRILVAREGINGAVSGTHNDIDDFKLFLHSFDFFRGLTFREQPCPQNTYHKLVVKVTYEIVRFETPVNMSRVGTSLSSLQLQQWYDTQEDFVLVDARNNYEYDVGKFQNAISLNIETFRDFPRATKKLEPLKNKKIVLYCTGGVRCEKASAYLNEQGFSHVYQLEGGIINYVNQFPHGYWEGGLYVFDDRLVSDVAEPITFCQFCHIPCALYINCHNLDCDRLVIMCFLCQQRMKKTCSEDCFHAPRQRQEKISERRIGIVMNYYSQKSVALLQLSDTLQVSSSIRFHGKTTNFMQEITELWSDAGESLTTSEKHTVITIPVRERVRKNDTVFISY